MTRVLLIGGESDGHWFDVSPLRPSIIVPCKPNLPAVPWSEQVIAKDAVIKQEQYTLQTLCEGEHEFVVYTHNVPRGRLIEKLLRGYKP